MTELIKISQSGDKQLVSARELYEFLEVRTDFTEWCKRMFEYGFQEQVDFTPIMGKSTGGRPAQDYALLIDCAKEIAMIQRTEKGKVARQYFIECEKQLRLVIEKPAIDFNDASTVLQLAQNWAEEQNKRKAIEKELEDKKPLYNYAQSLLDSQQNSSVGELAKILSQNGMPIGRTRLFEILRQDGYLIKQKGDEFNHPTQKARDNGFIVIKKSVVQDGARTITRVTPKITPKGQQHFINKFLNPPAQA